MKVFTCAEDWPPRAFTGRTAESRFTGRGAESRFPEESRFTEGTAGSRFVPFRGFCFKFLSHFLRRN